MLLPLLVDDIVGAKLLSHFLGRYNHPTGASPLLKLALQVMQQMAMQQAMMQQQMQQQTPGDRWALNHQLGSWGYRLGWFNNPSEWLKLLEASIQWSNWWWIFRHKWGRGQYTYGTNFGGSEKLLWCLRACRVWQISFFASHGDFTSKIRSERWPKRWGRQQQFTHNTSGFGRMLADIPINKVQQG